MTISVTGDYTVAAGETVSSVDDPAFYLQSTTTKAARLTNFGEVEVSGGDEGYLLIGIRSSASYSKGASFRNEADGVFRVDGSEDGRYAQGFSSYGRNTAVTNHGLFEVIASGGAGGVDSDNKEFVFTNTGTFTVVGGAYALGVMTGGVFANSGRFEVRSGSERAIGTYTAGDGGSFNSGVMIVTDATDALDSAAVQLGWGDGTGRFSNSGKILSKDYAVVEAVSSVGSTSRQALDNSGKIKGIIDLGAGADELRNTGVITGDIYLRSGNDIYGGGGRHDGAVYGGSGSDRLSGGAGADHLFGDHAGPVPSDAGDRLDGRSGADVLTGGGGADLFVLSRIGHSTPEAPDLITDLQAIDRIDLSRLDADTGMAGNQAFHLVAVLSGAAGEAALAYDPSAGLTRLLLDVDGDGDADAVLLMSGDHHDFTGFIL